MPDLERIKLEPKFSKISLFFVFGFLFVCFLFLHLSASVDEDVIYMQTPFNKSVYG